MLRRFLARQGFVVARRSAVGAQGDYDEELPEPAPQEEPAPPRRQRRTPRGGGQTPKTYREQQIQANFENFTETQRRLEAERQAQQPPPQPTPPPVPPPQAAAPAPINPMMLQRAAQVLGPQDEIGALAAEMLMRKRPS